MNTNDENNDLGWYALNYRTGSIKDAEIIWQELSACVDRLIAEEREACAAECERMMMYPGGKQEAPAHNDVWAAAAAIRARPQRRDPG